MTGLIFDIKKYALHDGPGIRTTIFFKGCPLDCAWCHNPESRNSEPEVFQLADCRRDQRLSGKTEEKIGRFVSADELMVEILKDQQFYEQSGGGVTFSGGEPMMQAGFLKVLLEKCRQENLHTAVDTSGFAEPAQFEMLRGLVDLYLYDLKLIDDAKHIKQTGESNDLIHQNLIALHDQGERINVRLPMIPGITDSDQNLAATAEFIEPLGRIREISLMPYNKMSEDKVARFGLSRRIENLETQSKESLSEKGRVFERIGRLVKIGG